MKIIEPNATLFFDHVIEGPSTTKTSKPYHEAKSFYKEIDESLRDDEVMYDVYRTTNESVGAKQDMMWGLTVLYPITVKGECNMTRGHFHADEARSEVYYGFGGEGLLLFMDKDGNTWAERVFKGSVHLIDGQFGHRLVNTSVKEPLKVVACWSKHAGYDYEYVEDNPFGYRIYNVDDKIVIKEN